MSYNLNLQCGCSVYVSMHPATRIAHTRILQTRGSTCTIKRHEIGSRLYLWELLPDPAHRARVDWADLEHARWTP